MNKAAIRQSSSDNNKRQWIIITSAIVLSALIFVIPVSHVDSNGIAPLTSEARSLAAIFVLTLMLWASEAIPIAVTALLAIVLQPLLGVTATREAFASFMSPVFFFVIAMFIIAGVIIEVRLDKRFALYLLAKAGTQTRRILFALMLGTALLSSVMSDVPACAVFMAVALGILAKLPIQSDPSAFAKALMMGIPIAALIGGIATPAGSSINVLALDLLDAFSRQHQLDLHISFLQWMAMGVPMVIVLLPFSWWVLLRCYPPEIKHIGSLREITDERLAMGSWSANEYKVMIIMSIMMLLWVAGSWIEILNVAIVALVGAILMFLPGINLIDWKQAENHIGWNTLMMIGGVTSLGQASVKTGLAEWLVQSTMTAVIAWPLVWVIAFICLLTVLIHLPLPIAPVVNAVLIPPIAALALTMGINPAIFVLPVAFTASCAFLLPLDAVPLLTFSKGYYRMFDMLLPGALISLAWVLLMTTLIIWLAPLLQLY